MVLISPTVEAVSSDPRLKVVTLPWLGDFLYTVYVGPYAIADSQDEYQAYVPGSDWRARELDAMQYIGTRQALLSTLRDMTGDPLLEYQALGKRGAPVELLWGDKDQTVPIADAQKIQVLIPQVEFHPIPGARHESPYEEPQVVNPFIISFLK